MTRLLTILLVIALSACSAAPPMRDAAILPAKPTLSKALSDVRALSAEYGDKIWAGFSKAHFGVVLVDEDKETLLCDARLPSGFVAGPFDTILGCSTAVGPKSWRQGNMLAAMPAFGPPSVIVMGSPEATRLALPEWKLTVLHEHFHQWQSQLPDYYRKVDALDLSNGDKTGAWMLDFAFPYDDVAVEAAFDTASGAMAEAIDTGSVEDFDTYLAARRKFEIEAGEKNWRYWEFQMWQEGVARWTEMAIGGGASDQNVRDAASNKKIKIMNALRNPDLKANRRVSVYAYGAGEAMLLDLHRPNWRRCYANQFALAPLLTGECDPPR